MKYVQKLIIATFTVCLFSCHETKVELSPNAVTIPITGNTYVTAGKEGAKLSSREGEKGISVWNSQESVLSSWFKASHSGELKLYMNAKAKDKPSTIEVRVLDKMFTIHVKDTIERIYSVGSVALDKAGYVRIDMQGKKKEGTEYADVSSWIIDGVAATEPLNFVRNFEPYWGLRGPSVHMNYALPDTDVEYFYNEITVPSGEDKIGSYFMTNGFAEGYCGIQVNSETERRVLFSVWSPFSTDNPGDIPEDQRIRLLAQGEGVHIGEFGNEGSGGQSYLIYPWKSGVTYPVITRIHPDGKGNTEYYAWFYAKKEDRWRLIAGFLRPQTDTWYKRAHSFLENFIPQQGYLDRKVYFDNQWVRTSKGDWLELIEGIFTNDATARAEVRMDFAGGVENGAFFLKNGGFFNDYTEYKSLFTRQAKGKIPEIDVSTLPVQ